MKRIFYSLALAAMAFASCKPLSKTYDELGDVPAPVVPVVIPPTSAAYTLAVADYAGLPASNPAALQGFFHGTTDAFASIPLILSKKYSNLGDKSTVNVTYATSPFVPTIKIADTLNANVAIALQTTPTNDYPYTAFTYVTESGTSIAVPAVTFNDLSAAQAIGWLRNKYKTLVSGTTYSAQPLPDYSIRVLSYLYFESGATPSSGVAATDAFLYTAANDWQKIYRVNSAQYASVGRGTNNWFLATDAAPTIYAYLNTFLKADPTVMLTAKIGDIQYVNYRYLTTYQRVVPMAYDGTNWVVSNTTATNLFNYNLATKTWTGQLDNSVSYTLTAANYATIGAITTNGSAGARANLIQRSNFAIDAGSAASGGVTDDGVRWKDAEIATGIKAILAAQFTAPSANQKFTVSYVIFGGYPTGTVFSSLFIYNATLKDFVYQPVADQAKYTLTGDDFTAIARGNIGSSSSSINLNQFGDFESRAGNANLWSADQISAGINLVLKTRYTTPTANQLVAVTYAIYNGANTLVTKSYKWDGTNWIAQ